MRNTFVNALVEEAAADPSIMLLTGDLGYRVVEGFEEAYPGRYLNAGIAEQDMIEVAAGLALEGHKVFVYSISGFPTLRCLEQIRNCLCYHDLDVTIICIGGGFAYGHLGSTHHATEDVAVMRAMPNMQVLSPADPAETRLVARYCFDRPGPKYVRLNRGGETDLPGADALEGLVTADFGAPLERVLRRPEGEGEGEASSLDVAFLATGAIATEANRASELLAAEGISSLVLTVPCLKPLDADTVISLGTWAKLLVSVEEHSVIGGLGSAVASTLASAPLTVPGKGVAPLLAVGIPDAFPEVVGDQSYLRHLFAMDAEGIAARVGEALAARASGLA